MTLFKGNEFWILPLCWFFSCAVEMNGMFYF